MINRKLLVEALRIDNKDVLPKFGSSELRKVMEAGTEYLNIDNLMDYEEGTLTDDGVYTIMDLLDHGSVGIADSDGQPALTFMKSGSDIHMHNQFTDEDLVLDATAEALKEAVADQLDTKTFEEGEAEQLPMELTNVVFKKEDDGEVLAVFPDDTDTIGDEMNILVYSHQGQHGYANPIYVEALEDATPEEYEPLAEELRGQGYNLNILNGMSADDQAPSTDMVDPYEGTYHEESVNEEMKNYGVLVAKDMGNESKILEIKEGFGSYEEAQEGIGQIEHEYDLEDPTLFTRVVYSDGVSWFIADTGEELDLEQYESVSEDMESNQIVFSAYTWSRAEDDWEEGEGDSKFVDSGKIGRSFDISSKEDIVRAVAEMTGFCTHIPDVQEALGESWFYYSEDQNAFVVDVQTGEDELMPTEKERELWRNGEYKVYSNIIFLYLEADSSFISRIMYPSTESASKPESYSPDIEAVVEDIEHSFATAGLSLGRRLLSRFGMDDSAFDKLVDLQGHVEERLDQVVEDIINNL